MQNAILQFFDAASCSQLT